VHLPDGLAFMVPTRFLPIALSSLFSWKTKLRVALEWFHPQAKIDGDESVASFVERHYGNQMVDRLVDPLLCGVYGGDAHQLSLRQVLPRFAEMQAHHGSLSRALVQHRKASRKNGAEKAHSLFTTLKNGMQGLVDAILRILPPSSTRSNVNVRRVSRRNGMWLIASNDETSMFDCVIVATPTHNAAELLKEDAPALASELRGIQYSSSVTVTLGFDREVRTRLPPGFGFLAPHNEGKRLIAVTFVHNKFPDRAPEDRAVIRCFLGGTRDEQVLQLSEQEIINIACDELRKALAISTEPLFARVYKWKGAMAQYNVGHVDKIARIHTLRRQLPGIFLAGNAYSGVGVPDCVRSGKQAASDALTAIGLAEPVSAL
jgi:protoporphyrinogen/coproporphyrinogen III oxidase